MNKNRPVPPLLICIAGLLCYFGGLLTVAKIADKSLFHTWIHGGVPALDRAFNDLAVVADGIKAEKNGYSPYENQCTEVHHLPAYNYPRIWTSLKYLGLSHETVPVAGVILAVLFWLATLAVTRPQTRGQALWVTAFLCSPMAMLAVERGNIDQAVFCLTAISVLIPTRHIWFSSAILLIAAIGKLFPLAALFSLWKDRGLKGALPLVAVVVIFSTYTLCHIADLRIISAATPRTISLSYGAAVPLQTLAMQLQINISDHTSHAAGLTITTMLTAWALWRARGIQFSLPGYHARAFLAGAGIYCGSFLIGNNFQYRAIFLLMCAPGLFALLNTSLARLARGVLGLILAWTWWDFFCPESLIRTATLKNSLSILLFAGLFTLGWKLRPWKPSPATAVAT